MTSFSLHKILGNNEIIAKELKRARLRKGISLQEASQRLKMNKLYLEYLEGGDFESLPRGVYRYNFLREYAVFLGLPADDLIGLFSENKSIGSNSKKEDLFVKKAKHVNYFITIPKIVKNSFVFIASLVCFIYLSIYINAIISPPKLIINSPSADTVTSKKEIVVQGSTDPGAEITINNELVLSDSAGVFAKKINLKNGINTIVIVSCKKHSRKNELVKKILVNDM